MQQVLVDLAVEVTGQITSQAEVVFLDREMLVGQALA
jgi:hypothetical protein